MPLTLAIDCSLRRINLGLAGERGLLGERAMDVGRGQAEVLPSAVDSMLTAQGVRLRDLRRIAVTVGPGYYTGIRVGLSYATALAEGLGIRVIPMTTLLAMAFPLLGTGRVVVPIVKARSGAVYVASYAVSAEAVDEVLPPRYLELLKLASTLRVLARPGSELLLAGADALLFEEIISLGYQIIDSAEISGASMLQAAEGIAPVDPADARAVYLRNPD